MQEGRKNQFPYWNTKPLQLQNEDMFVEPQRVATWEGLTSLQGLTDNLQTQTESLLDMVGTEEPYHTHTYTHVHTQYPMQEN